MALVSPLATKWILDSLDAGESLTLPVLLLVGLLVVGAAVSWWQWVMLGTLAENVVYEARSGMITRFIRAKVFSLLRRRTGELVTRVTSDSVLLREAASSSVIGLINGAVTLVGSLVLMAVLDVPLTVITVVAILVVAVVVTVLMPAISEAHERAQSALGSLGGDLEGSLRAIRTVKASNAEDRQLGSLLQHAADARVQGVKAVRREALIWTIAWVGTQAAIIAILGFGAWRVSIEAMTVSTLIAFLLYAFGILDPVMELSQNLATLQLGLAAAARIAEVETIDIESSGAGATSTGHPSKTGSDLQLPAIELRGVTARYDGSPIPAVMDLSMKIPHRGHVAIVGPSGAGKTTILALVLRFLEPDDGLLLLDGRTLRHTHVSGGTRSDGVRRTGDACYPRDTQGEPRLRQSPS
jgi:ATP-binding cassette subfamily B protein